MREVTDECCGCANENAVRYCCDKCKKEFEPEELYVDEDDNRLCATCILLRFPTVAELEIKKGWGK